MKVNKAMIFTGFIGCLIGVLVASAVWDYVLLPLLPSKKSAEAEPVLGQVRVHKGQIQYYDESTYLGSGCWGGKWICAKRSLRGTLGLDYGKRLNELQAQINCLERGGHEWVYLRRKSTAPESYEPFYIFKCERCKKTQCKAENELALITKMALQELGIKLKGDSE